MDLISECALRVAKVGWQPRHGSFAFTVVCKATFELRPELSPLAAVQEPVIEADVYTRDGGSLALTSELVPFKKRPEVLVVGHAYAPEGRPVPSLVARLVVGEIDKSLQVVGDRCFARDGRPDEPSRFLRMPLAWERAAGGTGTFNPAGRPLGSAARADLAGRVPAPNVLPDGARLTSQSDLVPPAGFGPIAPMWPSRAACLGRHAAWWDPNRWHERPLPDDIDLGYFNAAPPDQQRPRPFSEEVIYLEHLHPRFARLSTRLAPVAPAAMVDHSAEPQRLQLRCDTLVIDADRGLATLVWRAHVLLDRPDRPGRVVVTGPGVPEAALSGWDDEASDVEGTLAPSEAMRSSAVLPFSGAAAWDVSSAPPAVTGGRAAPPPAAVLGERPAQPSMGAATWAIADHAPDRTEAAGLVQPDATLPFAPSQEKSGPQREVAFQGGASGLPFVPAPAHDEGGGPSISRGQAPQESTPLRAAQGPWSASLGYVAAEPQSPSAEKSPWATGTPAPPPLLGAIMAVAKAPTEARDPAERDPPAKGGAVDEAPRGGVEPEVVLDAYPPERCGAIAARLACSGGEACHILRAEELDADRWQRVHEHWLDRIREEAARSRKKLLSDYDGAYVTALEAERGRIVLGEYVQLAEAAERSAVAGALAERALPEGAWPHIHRVWIGRMVKDARLAKQVREEIGALRALR